MSDRIQLNVGGTHFETTRQTLEQIPYFNAILARWNQEEIFVDRSAYGFDHILNLIRNPTYEFPRQYKHELDFYCLEYNLSPDPLDEMRKEIQEIRETQMSIMKKIKKIQTGMGYPFCIAECIDCSTPKVCDDCDKCACCCRCQCNSCSRYILCHECRLCFICDGCTCSKSNCDKPIGCGQCGRCDSHCKC